MAEKRTEAGSSNQTDDSLDGSLDVTSEFFNPMRALYAQNLKNFKENTETCSSDEQFERSTPHAPFPSVSSAKRLMPPLRALLTDSSSQSHGDGQTDTHSDSRDSVGEKEKEGRELYYDEIEAGWVETEEDEDGVEEDEDVEQFEDVEDDQDVEEMDDENEEEPQEVEMAHPSVDLQKGSDPTIGSSGDAVVKPDQISIVDKIMNEARASLQKMDDSTELLDVNSETDVITPLSGLLENKLQRESGSEKEIKPKTETKETLDDISSGEEELNKAGDKDKKTVTMRRKTLRNVLTELKDGYERGPMSLLRRSVAERLRVRVFTRGVRGIRGISTGYVLAFDKHMNLAMFDVDEVYRKPNGKHQRKIKNPLGAEAENVSSSKDVTMEEEREDAAYPKTPWQQVKRDGNAVRHPWYASKNYVSRAPADGIGDLPSVFSGLHVFQNSEETCLLGCKNRRVLTRHLNQVLLRGDHVVAVALAP